MEEIQKYMELEMVFALVPGSLLLPLGISEESIFYSELVESH